MRFSPSELKQMDINNYNSVRYLCAAVRVPERRGLCHFSFCCFGLCFTSKQNRKDVDVAWSQR